jgi:hypothetical protein
VERNVSSSTRPSPSSASGTLSSSSPPGTTRRGASKRRKTVRPWDPCWLRPGPTSGLTTPCGPLALSSLPRRHAQGQRPRRHTPAVAVQLAAYRLRHPAPAAPDARPRALALAARTGRTQAAARASAVRRLLRRPAVGLRAPAPLVPPDARRLLLPLPRQAPQRQLGPDDCREPDRPDQEGGRRAARPAQGPLPTPCRPAGGVFNRCVPSRREVRAAPFADIHARLRPTLRPGRRHPRQLAFHVARLQERL